MKGRSRERGVEDAPSPVAPPRFTSAHSAICGDSSTFAPGWVVPIGLRDRVEKLRTPAAVPHFDPARRGRRGRITLRLGMKLLEIAADRDRFGNDLAVVQLERGHGLETVDRGIGRAFSDRAGRDRARPSAPDSAFFARKMRTRRDSARAWNCKASSLPRFPHARNENDPKSWDFKAFRQPPVKD